LLALNIVDMSGNERFLILSDSLSCLQSIENRKLTLWFSNLLFSFIVLSVDGKQLAFMWLPRHTGLAGNVSACAAAKAALNLPESLIPVPYSDLSAHKLLHLHQLATAVECGK
jgi:hypothetical protein